MVSPRMQSIVLDEGHKALNQLHPNNNHLDNDTVCTEEVTTVEEDDDDLFELDHTRYITRVPLTPRATTPRSITTFHGMICDQLYGSPLDNISAKAMVHNNSHCAKQPQAHQPMTGGILEHCVDTFARNVDVVQAQTEQWTQDLAQVAEEKGWTTFVQARMNTFTRNLETIGAILAGT